MSTRSASASVSTLHYTRAVERLRAAESDIEWGRDLGAPEGYGEILPLPQWMNRLYPWAGLLRRLRRPTMPRLVLDMNDRRPVWAMPPQVPERLGAVAVAEVYLGYGIPPELLRAGRLFRWVHTGAAGVASSLTPEMRESPVTFTNSDGVHALPMAETALARGRIRGAGLDVFAPERLSTTSPAPSPVAGTLRV